MKFINEIKKVNYESKNNIRIIKATYLTSIASETNPSIRSSHKKTYYDDLELNMDEWLDLMLDVNQNFFFRIILNIIYKVKTKFYRMNSTLFNFGYKRNLNRQVIFTASMAGETLWKKMMMNSVRGIFLLIMGFIVIFPFYWMISIAFRSNEEIINSSNDLANGFSFWPQEWSTEAFQYLFNNPALEKAGLSVWVIIGNSILIAVLSTTTQLVCSLIGGFGLSHYNSRGKEVLIIILLSTMMLPGEAMLIGQFIIASDFGLRDTIWALFIPFIGNAFTIFMFKNAFDQVNQSIKNAAKVDGVHTFKFFVKVSLPLIRTTIFTSALISFISAWNAVLWPTMVLEDNSRLTTLPMLLWKIIESAGLSGSDWHQEEFAQIDPVNLKMAVSLVAITPMVVVFACTKKYLIKGITKDSGAKQ